MWSMIFFILFLLIGYKSNMGSIIGQFGLK